MLNPSLSSSTRRRDSTRQPLENFLEKGEEGRKEDKGVKSIEMMRTIVERFEKKRDI